jgi:hypothetical protein
MDRSPFWWYDFYFEGKRYRASTGQESKAAAGTVAAAALTRLTEGSNITKRSHKAPPLRGSQSGFSPGRKTLTHSNRTPASSMYMAGGFSLTVL